MLTRIGGARNCLLVYVADGAVTVVPVFPFNLMFLPEIYGLEMTAPISNVRATPKDGLLGRRVLLTVVGPREKRFELWLRNPQEFLAAIEGKRSACVGPIRSNRLEKPRAGWRLNFFRLFAVIWGVVAVAAGITGLAQDLNFRSQGKVVVGRIVGHTGEIGARNDMGVVQYEVGGRPYTLTSIRGSGIYKIGDMEKVRYMPHDPASAREEGYLGFDLLFASLGSLMLILAATIGRITRFFNRSMNV